MKILIANFIIAASLLIAGIIAISPAVVLADAKSDVCKGVGIATGGPEDCSDPVGSPSIDSAVRTGINILSLIVGVASVVMIIIGGLKYITSGGDSGNITGAKNTILYAIVGLVVVALAQVIVRFVLTTTTQTQCPPGQSRPAADQPCR